MARGNNNSDEALELVVPYFDGEAEAREWCTELNVDYAGSRYQASIATSRYLVSVPNSLYAGTYRPSFLTHEDGSPLEHVISGILKRAEMGPAMGVWALDKALQYEPFVYLGNAKDMDADLRLGDLPDQMVKIPLLGSVLTIDRALEPQI